MVLSDSSGDWKFKRSEGKYEEAKKSYLVILDQSKDEEMKKAAREFMNG